MVEISKTYHQYDDDLNIGKYHKLDKLLDLNAHDIRVEYIDDPLNHLYDDNILGKCAKGFGEVKPGKNEGRGQESRRGGEPRRTRSKERGWDEDKRMKGVVNRIRGWKSVVLLVQSGNW
ncbi:hypothetical protein ACH5RR_006535 [Cinchona calisaya]|uniref:Uncharacterized protein n=1 Tax=Cinchona calisaya TaxID=153742 RepID=A0ABD3APN4_9GENT